MADREKTVEQWLKERTLLERINSGKETVNLYGMRLGSNGARAVCELLRDNTTIKTLWLSLNNIGPDGAKAIVGLLKDNNTLKDLSLRKNSIGPDGAMAIADVLKMMTLDPHRSPDTIPTVDLSHNGFKSVTGIPSSAFKDGNTLRAYLVALHDKAATLDRVQVKLVGFGGAGKTTARLTLFDADARLLEPGVTSWSAEDAARWAALAGLPASLRSLVARFNGKSLTDDALFNGVLAGVRSDGDARKLREARDDLVAQARVAARHAQPLYVSTAGVQAGAEQALEMSKEEVREHGADAGFFARLFSPKVTLQAVDFAGQAEYMLMHASFLGGAHAVYLVCANLTGHPQQRGADRPASRVGDDTDDAKEPEHYPVNEHVADDAAHWVGELEAQLGAGPMAEAPVVVALTFGDKYPHDAAAARERVTARLAAQFPERFSGDKGRERVVVINGAAPEDPGTLRLRGEVRRQVFWLSRRVIQPEVYQRGAKLVRRLAAKVAKRGELLSVPFGEVAAYLARKDKAFAADEDLARRVVLFLHESMEVLLPDEGLLSEEEVNNDATVLLRPLEWLPAAITRFVADPGHTPGQQPVRRDLPGVYRERSVLDDEEARVALLGAHYRGDEAAQRRDATEVLRLLERLNLCLPAAAGDEVAVAGSSRALREAEEAADSAAGRLLVFPSTLPYLDAAEAAALWASPGGGDKLSLRGGRWHAAGARLAVPSGRVPPSLVPLLQVRLRRLEAVTGGGGKGGLSQYSVAGHFACAASATADGGRVVWLRGARRFTHVDVWARSRDVDGAAAALEAVREAVRELVADPATLEWSALCAACLVASETPASSAVVSCGACPACGESAASPEQEPRAYGEEAPAEYKSRLDVVERQLASLTKRVDAMEDELARACESTDELWARAAELVERADAARAFDEAARQRLAELDRAIAAASSSVDADVRELLREHRVRKAAAERRAALLADPAAGPFYRAVQLKLTELLLAYKVLASGKVKGKQSFAVTLASEVFAFVGGRLLGAIVSGAVALAAEHRDKFAAKAASSAAQFMAGRAALAGHRSASGAVPTLRDLERLCEAVAAELAWRYDPQLRALASGAGASTLGECAVYRVAKYVDKGDADPDGTSALDAMVRAVYRVKARQGFAGLKNLRLEGGDGSWTEAGVFERSGMEGPGGERSAPREDSKHAKYGFSRVRDVAEIEARGDAMQRV